MSNSTLEVQAHELGVLWKDTTSSIYCEIASLMFLLYDHAITIDQEVERIWKAPWSLPKILFLFNRYTGPISLLCGRWIHFEGAAGITAMASVEMIMIFRLYALYRRSKTMLVLLLLGFIGNIGAMSVLMQLGLQGITIFPRPGPWYKGCHPVGLPKFFWAYYVSPLMALRILLVLTLYKTLGHIRAKITHTPVIKLFFRDGVAYFAVIFCTLLSNALIWMLAPPGLLESGIGLAIAMPTVMGSRMLLNLRGLSASTPDASEATAVSDNQPSPGQKYEHGARAGRARVLPTLTQWTVSGEETILARMQEAEAEKYSLHGTVVDVESSPASSLEKGKGKEIDLEMSPMSSSMSPRSDIGPTLPHDSHFGRWDQV
ncbi:transmembrane protein [Ceratobasidium sp. AG-Ba]|nr:transmembrane protein [Ceratobasidium sp. AG-Ba]